MLECGEYYKFIQATKEHISVWGRSMLHVGKLIAETVYIHAAVCSIVNLQYKLVCHRT